MTERLVVIGNGMAAARFVEELDARARGRYAVAVIGAEPHLAYNRVLLSSLLAGEIAQRDLELQSAEWWRARGVTLIYGSRASGIDRADRVVSLQDGREIAFSKCVIATGSSPIRLSIPGAELPGVSTFRDISDVGRISRFAVAGKRTVVIGGGLLGLEAAYGIAKQGGEAILLHLMPHLMERQLDTRASELLRNAVEAKGIHVILEADTTAIDGSDTVKAVRLKDGRRIACDFVVMALGVRPNCELAKAAGISVNRGIVVNKRLETSTREIFAIGECAEHRGICYGLVEPAYEQARVLAENLAGKSAEYSGSTLSTNLKVSGVNVFSAGDFLGDEGSEDIVLSDPCFGTYKRLVVRDNRLAGAVLFGDTRDGLWYLDLIRSGENIAGFRDLLAFGRAFAAREAA